MPNREHGKKQEKFYEQNYTEDLTLVRFANGTHIKMPSVYLAFIFSQRTNHDKGAEESAARTPLDME